MLQISSYVNTYRSACRKVIDADLLPSPGPVDSGGEEGQREYLQFLQEPKDVGREQREAAGTVRRYKVPAHTDRSTA